MTSTHQNPDYLGHDEYFSSPPRSLPNNNNNNSNAVETPQNGKHNSSFYNNNNSAVRPFNISSSSYKATRNKILDSKRLRLFSGDDTIFVVRTNNNAKSSDEEDHDDHKKKNNKKNKTKNQQDEAATADASNEGDELGIKSHASSSASSSADGDDDENEEELSNNRTMMMLLMIQQQETNNALLNFSPGNSNWSAEMGMPASPAVRQMLPQSVWHVSNIVNLHLPGLLWSDPESSGKWQRWLLRAIPEMVNLVRLDVRDGQMGDLWCRALMDALIEQKVNAGIKKSSMVQASAIFSPRQTKPNPYSSSSTTNTTQQVVANNNNNNDTPSIFVLHMENNFITQQSIQYIGRFFSAVASQLQEIKSTSSAGGAGFLVELYLTGNSKIGDHGAQVLAAHALKGASVHEVTNRVVLRFLDICGCEVGGRGLSDLLANCGGFCSAVICEGWRHFAASSAHQHFNHHYNQQALALPQQNPASILSRDAMRNIPAVTALRVVDLSGSGHRMSTTAFNVLLPALLVCCPRLRAIGFGQVIRSSSSSSNNNNNQQQQTFTTSNQLVRSLIDSLTSLCRSCQRAPALEFIDMSGCHISDPSILKLIEFITREKAREQAGKMMTTMMPNNNNKNNSRKSSNQMPYYLRLRILDVSDGEVLPDDDRSKAPITIGGGGDNNNNNSKKNTANSRFEKEIQESTQLHVRSSLGKDTWRAIMLACAMEDDETLQVICDGVRKDRSGNKNNKNNNKSTANDRIAAKNSNNDDDEELEKIREYIQAVTSSPSSRYTKSLLKRSRSSRLALEHGESEEEHKRRMLEAQVQQQRSEDEKQQQEEADRDAKEEAVRIAKQKKDLEEAEIALRKKERDLQETEERIKLQREKQQQDEADRLQNVKKEQERRQQDMQRLEQQQLQEQQRLKEKEELLEQQRREQEEKEQQRLRAEEQERQLQIERELEAQRQQQQKLIDAQKQKEAQEASEEIERRNKKRQQEEEDEEAENARRQQQLPPPSLDASPIDMANKTQIDDANNTNDNENVDRALDFTNNNLNAKKEKNINHNDDDDADTASSASFLSAVISEATSILSSTNEKYLLSQANRSYTITVAHDPDQHPLLCCVIPLIAGGVPTAALFTQLFLADLQLYTNANHNDKHSGSDQTNVVVEKVQTFLDGTFVVSAKTSARRHVVDHIVKAAFAAPVTEAFPRLLRVVNGVMDRSNRIGSSVAVPLMVPPNGDVVDCPKIERCQRHRHMPFEIPPAPPLSASTKSAEASSLQEKDKEDQQRADELKLRQDEEEQQEIARKKKEQEEKDKAAAVAAANPVLSVKQRIQEKLEAEKKKRQEAAAAAASAVVTANDKKEDDLSKTATPHNEAADKTPSAVAEGQEKQHSKNGNDDDDDDDKNAKSEANAAAASPPPPPPPPQVSKQQNHHINVFNFEDYAKKAQQKNKDRAAKVAAASATATKSSSLFLRAAASASENINNNNNVASSNTKKPSTDIFAAPPPSTTAAATSSSPSSRSTSADASKPPTGATASSVQELTVAVPILPIDAQRTQIRAFFSICLKCLKEKHVLLPDDSKSEVGARNKQRVLKGWIVERAQDIAGEERQPDEAPRYTKQQVVVNVEWGHFLVIKTCTDELFESQRELYFMHPLLGNALYPSSSLSESSGNNQNNNNNNTSVVNGNNNGATITPYELRRVEPLCRPGGNDSVVFFFVTPRGNVHAMNFIIDPKGFGDEWSEEKTNSKINNSSNIVMKVLNRLNYAVAKSSEKILAAGSSSTGDVNNDE